ncbi:hypothetical protein GALMADRAFT_217127 [Galerina marginata CBS 339.88]|uniref:Uncharacterized protein n=1 Tax=Galerina marginata (strain CBS 339.88) TaxID=685588 RepID=A0A067SHK8_GALM3|nr:hypothetical protein GALMADRAFT_217127 [Galerina marginata CBS 339.88]
MESSDNHRQASTPPDVNGRIEGREPTAAADSVGNTEAPSIVQRNANAADLTELFSETNAEHLDMAHIDRNDNGVVLEGFPTAGAIMLFTGLVVHGGSYPRNHGSSRNTVIVANADTIRTTSGIEAVEGVADERRASKVYMRLLVLAKAPESRKRTKTCQERMSILR